MGSRAWIGVLVLIKQVLYRRDCLPAGSKAAPGVPHVPRSVSCGPPLCAKDSESSGPLSQRLGNVSCRLLGSGSGFLLSHLGLLQQAWHGLSLPLCPTPTPSSQP